ncbi:MAG: type II toxin-antitoxin system RelE/ParE family toxin [Anaerolineales bacterium]|uniref:type II toxin-antitoxin system RelE family toxin n=1 Tax=Candidatus Villigracilis vicinus TaxID=3140679 RepID=UPI0031365048|nr:type II toxin-antitoxin system RelE/ParE family toxin [Anaerolineales bacterium]
MASYKIEWKNSAYKELQKLPRPMIAKVVAAVSDLANDPFPHGVKKLVGSELSYRIRIGDYRVVYEVFENKLIIEIVRVRHRKDVYR